MRILPANLCKLNPQWYEVPGMWIKIFPNLLHMLQNFSAQKLTCGGDFKIFILSISVADVPLGDDVCLTHADFAADSPSFAANPAVGFVVKPCEDYSTRAGFNLLEINNEFYFWGGGVCFTISSSRPIVS